MFQLQFSLLLITGLLFPSIVFAWGSNDLAEQAKLVLRVDLIELNHRYDDQGMRWPMFDGHGCI